MYTRIEAAEEIQLLLPDNQPGRELEVSAMTVLGLGLLVLAIPACWLGLRGERTPA